MKTRESASELIYDSRAVLSFFYSLCARPRSLALSLSRALPLTNSLGETGGHGSEEYTGYILRNLSLLLSHFLFYLWRHRSHRSQTWARNVCRQWLKRLLRSLLDSKC